MRRKSVFCLGRRNSKIYMKMADVCYFIAQTEGETGGRASLGNLNGCWYWNICLPSLMPKKDGIGIFCHKPKVFAHFRCTNTH